MESPSERVKEALRRSGLSASALAQKAGLKARGHIGLIINNSTGAWGTDVETLRAIARAVPDISENWMITGSGSPDDPPDGHHVEREPQPAYSEGEAPLNFNLPNWDALVAGALALEEARAVPECFIEIVGYDNGLLTGPLRPADVLKLAKLTAEYRTAGEVEAMLATLRAKHGRPPLRRGEAVASRPRAVKPVKAGGGGG